MAASRIQLLAILCGSYLKAIDIKDAHETPHMFGIGGDALIETGNQPLEGSRVQGLSQSITTVLRTNYTVGRLVYLTHTAKTSSKQAAMNIMRISVPTLITF